MGSQEERHTPLRLGSTVPDFEAEVFHNGSIQKIDFHKYIEGSWAILFSHPDDFTPVCTTELGAFSKAEPEFTRRGCKLIGLSANTPESHEAWIKDINEVSNTNLKFPIIADKDRKIAYTFDMLDYQDTTNVDSKGLPLTVRSVFFIDPAKKIRLILTYPAAVGRSVGEVLRCLDALLTGERHRVTTPINWVPGDRVIVAPPVKTEEAKKLWPEMEIVKPYLRFTPLPKEKTSAA